MMSNRTDKPKVLEGLRIEKNRKLLAVGLCMALLALVSIAAKEVAKEYARSLGSIDNSQVTRVGVASDIKCSRNWVALGNNWRCQTSSITWQGSVDIPRRVKKQKEPYEILSETDITGQRVQVTGYLSMGWRTSGRVKHSTDNPVELLVTDNHPVGSEKWYALEAWAPIIAVLLVVTPVVAVFVVKQRRGRKG